MVKQSNSRKMFPSAGIELTINEWRHVNSDWIRRKKKKMEQVKPLQPEEEGEAAPHETKDQSGVEAQERSQQREDEVRVRKGLKGDEQETRQPNPLLLTRTWTPKPLLRRTQKKTQERFPHLIFSNARALQGLPLNLN